MLNDNFAYASIYMYVEGKGEGALSASAILNFFEVRTQYVLCRYVCSWNIEGCNVCAVIK